MFCNETIRLKIEEVETDVKQVENGEAFCPTLSDREQASLPRIFSASRFVSNR